MGLDVSFSLVLETVNRQEVTIFAFCCTSTMVVFALERANVDVLLFLMFIATGTLNTDPIVSRVITYSLQLRTGRLKFHPLVGLSIALRERPHMFIGIGFDSSAILLAFIFADLHELAAIRWNIPRGSFAADIFSVSNIPSGFAAAVLWFTPGLRQSTLFEGIQIACVAISPIAIATRAFLLSSNPALTRALAHKAEPDKTFLTLGAALIVGCFFTGRSVG